MHMATMIGGLALAAEAPTETLNAGGWIMMGGSILLVCGLSAFCLYRIVREPTPGTHHHAPLEIETDDLDS